MRDYNNIISEFSDLKLKLFQIHVGFTTNKAKFNKV